MKALKFSILVPVYNVEQYLEQCVDSLLNQTYTGDYEIILVDDGSTDSSGKICDTYAEKHPEKVKVIHKKNGGLVSARQAGIADAQGEYTLFIDSDDFAELDLLESLDGTLDSNSLTDIVVFNMNYFSSNKKAARKTPFEQAETVYTAENKTQVFDLLITTSFVTSLCLKAVKTELFKSDPTDYRLYYDKNMAEDLFRSTPLLTAANKIVYLNKTLYNYRTNDASISRSFRPETIEKKNTLYVYERFIEYLPVWGMDTQEHRHKLNARWLGETMYTFRQYYENVAPKDRKAVLNFDWSSMLPEETKSDINNPYENKVNRRLYSWLTDKKFFKIRFYFFKKRAHKTIKKLLKRGR